MKKKILYIVMIIFYVIMFGFLAVPGWQGLVDKIEPHILGLPCYEAWIVYGSLLMAIGLIVWTILDFKFDDEEIAEAEKNGGEVNE